MTRPTSSRVSREFARVLRKHRLTQGFSQEALAHRARVHRTYVGLIERGRRNATLDVADRLAKALGLLLSDMLAEAEEG